MGALHDTKLLLENHPLTFLTVGVVVAIAVPVLSVSTSAALRPWAKRIVATAPALRREARRIAAESREAYADLVAEVVNEDVAEVSPRAPPRQRTARLHDLDSSLPSSAQPVA